MTLVSSAPIADTAAENKQNPHEPSFHQAGWSIAIETPQGIVGLWSYWLGNRFYLGYPKSATFEDQSRPIYQIIKEILDVEMSEPVAHVMATTVLRGYAGEFKDSDKSLEQVDDAFIAYKSNGVRRWGQFYGPRVSGDCGRVWVELSSSETYAYHFDVIDSGKLRNVMYGYDLSLSILTSWSNNWNKYAPDGPTTDPLAVQPYRDKFLALACELARLLGGAMAVNINYESVLTPEQLPDLGYENLKWIDGGPGKFPESGHSILYAEKPETGDELILESGNSMVPWSTIRRNNRRLKREAGVIDLTAEELLEYLTF